MSTSPKEAVIGVEQKAVDRAYACYEARLNEMTDRSTAKAAASGKDGIAAQAQAETAAAEYRLDGEALVVMRVDTQEEGEEKPETWYVGRRSVFDVDTRDHVVVSWTNKIAVAWRQALPSAPGDVRLRRLLDCDGRTVKDYRDEIARLVPVSDDQEAAPRRVPTPGDLVGRTRPRKTPADDFLLRELDRSRTRRMRDIVETMQPDQLALVANAPADVLVIQGGPGTGKSAVGLHRVTWLVDNKHFRAQDILVIGPHRGFLDYVGRVLPTLGTRNVTAVELARLWTGDVRGVDTPQTRRVKSDDRMAMVLRRRVDGNCRPDAVDSLVTVPASEQDEPALTVILGSAPLRVPRSEIVALFEEARNGPGHYRARRDRFRDLVVDRLLAALSKGFPHRGREQTVRRDIERHRLVNALVERTWPRLSPEEALRTLLNSPDRLAECASQVLSDEEQALLQRPTAGSAAEEPWTPDDLVCLEELRQLIAGDVPRRYPHIVVDEAQDLTPMQARSLRRRCPSGSMTVLGDLAQATGPHGYSNWERLGKILSAKSGWHLTELRTSYRVPDRIMEFVAPLAKAVAPSVPFPSAVKEAGDDAVRVLPTTPWQLLDDAVAQAARLVGSDGRSQRSIAVVVPDDSDWLEQVQHLVDEAEDMTDEVREAVSVLAAAQAKGMEFDHVLVLEPSTIVARGPEGLRQLYVALTRSTQTLTVLHTSPLPEAMLPKAGGGAPAREGESTGSREQMCTRYHADGQHCDAPTAHTDGWCRTPSCEGFRTREPQITAPGPLPSLRVPPGSDNHARLAADVTADRLRVTATVIQAFVSAHGGTAREAEAEVRLDLKEFLEHARQTRQADGYWLLDHLGYRFVLSPDATAVTGYRTVHAERSYAQYKAGITSRYGSKGGFASTGPRLETVEAVRALTVADIPIAIRLRQAYTSRVPGLHGSPEDEVTEHIRRSFSDDLHDGYVKITHNGPLLVIGRTLTWSLTPDGSALKFVRGHSPLDSEVYAAQQLPTADELDVGTALRVRVLDDGDGTFVPAAAVPPDPHRRFVLQLRASVPNPPTGTELDSWIVRRQNGVYIVSTDDFGRTPISQSMAERYVAALGVLEVLAETAPEEAMPAQALVDLSELKGMANRCLRRDQPDWLAVWRLLGSPDPDRLEALRYLAWETRQAGKSSDTAALERLSATLRDSGWTEQMAEARAELLRSTAADVSPLLAELTTSAAQDRECRTHEAVRLELKAALLRAGVDVADSAIIDISRAGEPGPVLYEVLQAGHASYPDIRAGAVRLREIDHVTHANAEHLFVVLPEAPTQAWTPEVISKVLGVSVVWRTASGWAGVQSERATGNPAATNAHG